MAFAVVLGVVAPLPISSKVAGRFHWLYVHPVPGAMFLMIALIVALAYTRSRDLRGVLAIWPQWVYGTLTLVFVLAVILTKTRGSIGGAFAGVVALIIFHTRTKTKVDVLAFGTAISAAIALLAGPLILSYLARGEDIQKISTLNERTNLWSDAFNKFVQRPVEGYGLGASRGIFLEEIRLGGGHNAFINAMVDAGTIGLLGFVALIVILGWTLWHFRRGTPGHRDALILFPLLVAIVVNSMTAEFAAVPATTASIWLLVMVAWTSVLQRADTSYERADALT
jgi:O-antigen ligase